jgi:nucleoid-associated protein YgaU
VDGPTEQPLRRTLTPAVLVSALFVAASALIAIAFVASRGGLQMPVAATGSVAAVASPGPTTAPPPSAPATSVPPSPAPSAPTPTGSLEPSAAPSAPPATPVPTPTGQPDPLAKLPGCPDQPGCYEYRVQRGDSLSGVASRYAIPVSIVLALNPDIIDPGTIVVGQVLYLGRGPFLRLPPCPDVPDCSLYTVRPGDRLSTIAGRFGITVQSILDANDAITDPNAIFSGQVIRLPHPKA